MIVKKLVSKELVKIEQAVKDRREYEINITSEGLLKLKEFAEHIASRKAISVS